jgi:hypothetical protein
MFSVFSRMVHTLPDFVFEPSLAVPDAGGRRGEPYHGGCGILDVAEGISIHAF